MNNVPAPRGGGHLYAMRCRACSATALALAISPRLTLKAMYWIHRRLLFGAPISSRSKSAALEGLEPCNRATSALRMLSSSAFFCCFSFLLLDLLSSSGSTINATVGAHQ